MKEKEVLVKEERLDVSWIKEVSNSQYTVKQGTAFVKFIPRLELPHFSGDLLEWPQFISLTPITQTYWVCDKRHVIEKCERFLGMDVIQSA